VESAFHYRDKARFLLESSAVLKPGGVLVVADIILGGNKKGSWLSRRLGRALSAARFFRIEDYRQAGASAGLSLVHADDITANVRRTMPFWRNAFLRKCPVLLKRYSPLTLLKIGLALLIGPLLPLLTPFRYVILAFRKQPDPG
jgi:hypothetical protein